MIPRHRPEFGGRDLLRVLWSGAPDLATELSSQLGRASALWVPSGRAGLAAALSAVRARAAIVPAFNCWAVMHALQWAGTAPLFVDIADDLNPDVDQTMDLIRKAPEGTALLLTHQFGIPMKATGDLLAEARDRGMPVIEDAAAAIGAQTDAGPTGSLGGMSVVSFQYTKSVFAGDGGLLLLSQPISGDLFSRSMRFESRSGMASAREWLKLLTISVLTHPLAYRWTAYRALPLGGTRNERDLPAPTPLFHDLPSAWMRRLAGLTWQRLGATLEVRRRLARFYLDALSGLSLGLVPSVASEEAAPIRFPILVERRSEFIQRCAEAGLDLGRSFPYTCSDGGYPRAERVADTIVNLPLTGRLERKAPDVVRIIRRATR